VYANPACATEDPELFFPARPKGGNPKHNRFIWLLQLATAKAVCGRCTHQAQCLEDNLRVPVGIWGGATEDERRRMRRRLGITAQNMSPLPNDAYVLAQRARRERERAEAETEAA
jgi:hypothetical protein